MKKYIALFTIVWGSMSAIVPAHAANLLDWIEPATSTSQHAPNAPADTAQLLTLEPGEAEMFPQTSPDGHHLLVVTEAGKNVWISRRSAENGDPLNVVVDEPSAVSSMHWADKEQVTFLSQRAGSLAVWQMHADGQGLVQRVHMLDGVVVQAIPLHDGSLLAVRLQAHASSKKSQKSSTHRSTSDFNTWAIPGYESELVRIADSGSIKVLSAGCNPALSPDGTRVLFSMAEGRSMHLYVMNIDGSDLVQMTQERSVDVQPTWSIDGEWVIFTSNRAHMDRNTQKNAWDIWAIDRNGRQLTQLTMDDANDGAPSVGVNGRVYFHSDRQVPAAAKDARQVRNTKGYHIWYVDMPKGSSSTL